MRTALHRHGKPTTASAPAHIAPIDASPAPQAARPTPLHDISGVAIGETVQRKPSSDGNAESYRAPNRTGLPDGLKAGIEARSGFSLDHVRVHTNSDKPAQLNAHAYTMGTDIHVAPGRERHLAHEAWHVVQQAQARVRPTIKVAGVGVNDDSGLEREADAQGAASVAHGASLAAGTAANRAMPPVVARGRLTTGNAGAHAVQARPAVVQRVMIGDVDITKASPRETIVKALEWTKFYGISANVSKDKLSALRDELASRNDCVDIRDDIQSRLEDSDTEEEEEIEWDDDEETPASKQVPSQLDNYIWGTSPQEQEQETRKQLADAFDWKSFPEAKNGYIKLGVHETRAEGTRSLVVSGPSAERFGTGHGLGKGRGFYVTHVGQKLLRSAIKGMAYFNNFVVIYVPASWPAIQSPDEQSNSVAHLDKTWRGTFCYYVMSGGSEIVIPERCFPFVKVVANQKDLDNLQRAAPKHAENNNAMALVTSATRQSIPRMSDDVGRAFGILGLLSGDFGGVEAAWRRIALASHPDKGGDVERFKLALNARTTLLKQMAKGPVKQISEGQEEEEKDKVQKLALTES
jgi:hypothetical protein